MAGKGSGWRKGVSRAAFGANLEKINFHSSKSSTPKSIIKKSTKTTYVYG